MSTTESTTVLVHSIKVIQQRFVKIAKFELCNVHTLLLQLLRDLALLYHLREVKPLYWEVNERLNLVTERARVREAFQVHDEDVGHTPQVKFLCRLLVLLALRAVPEVIFS